MKLFAGEPGAYGTHGVPEANANKSGKMEIKKSARTVRAPVTEELWAEHLGGVRPIGIIPIYGDGFCSWGCVDVDDYALDIAALVRRIESLGFPLTVCRTKSGGAHLFLFLSEPTSAEDVRAALHSMAAALGRGTCEIFPKQTHVLAERGDMGNWLNMPYFDGDKTERYGVKATATAMSVTEFLRIAEGARTNLNAVQITSAKSGRGEDNLDDGPPCLQHLAKAGFAPGTRNNGLFALGIFCKKKFGDRWADVLGKFNNEFMTPPLDASEVTQTVHALERRDYNYRCKDVPLVDHCNSAVCRTRRFGVGGGAGGGDGGELYPNIGGLSVLDTDPPLWFADVDGKRVELTTEQLQIYRMFQKVCMERLYVCFQNLSQNTWTGMVGQAMMQVIHVEAPPDTSVHGYFLELLEEFCTNRHRAEAPEGLLQGKPYEDEAEGKVYFKLSALTRHLEINKFTTWGRNKVSSEVRALGGASFFNLKNKTGVRVLWVPNNLFQAHGPEPLPRSQGAPI